MVKNENRGETENQILDAARKVFQEKGLKGARMQEIADLAGINKAMLHYYFRSKDMLFQAIYAKAFEDISLMMNGIFQEELPLFEKIRKFVDYR
jgi:AcrR family transcriptional regulator